MNPQTHRLIYNASPGCIMAVAETVGSGKSSGKSNSRTTRRSKCCQRLQNITSKQPAAQQKIARAAIEFIVHISASPTAALTPIFNKDKVKADVQAQVQITTAFGQNAVPAAAKFADNKAVELRKAGNEEEAKKWDEGGAYRIAMHTVIGGLGGGAGGALGAGTSAIAIPVLGEEIAKLNLPEAVRQGLTQIIGLGIGAAAGGAAGAATGVTQTALNYVSHSPFANVRTSVSKENARLQNACEPHCSEADYRRMDLQIQTLEAAGNLSAISQTSKLTTAQAIQLGESMAVLLPIYGTPIALYQALSGQSLTGTDLSTAERFFNAVAGAIPAGSAAYRLMNNAVADLRVAAQAVKVNDLKIASAAEFVPNGIKVTPDVMASPQAQAMIAEARAANPSATAAQIESRVSEWLQSGSNIPATATAAPGSVLIKIVPKGDGVTAYTPYWFTPEQARAIGMMTPEQAGQVLGLPAAQAAKIINGGADYFAITPKVGMTPKVFVSDVAPTIQGGYITAPNAQQVIVPNRNLWNPATPVDPLTLRSPKK